MKRICVYCGSNAGHDPAFLNAARETGAALARRGLGLVYGAGSTGLMGAIADAVLSHDGNVIGITPRFFLEDYDSVIHMSLSELQTVETMHERKAAMIAQADGFIAMPGGYGTLEEMFEAITWAQLGIHSKPCGLLNTSGYYDGLGKFLDHVSGQAFLGPDQRALLMLEADIEVLLDRMGF